MTVLCDAGVSVVPVVRKNMSCGTLYTQIRNYIIQSVPEILQVEGQAAAALNKRKRRGQTWEGPPLPSSADGRVCGRALA